MNALAPLTPAQATVRIRAIMKADPTFNWTDHAKEQMAERDLTTGDVKYVLKFGYVYEEAQKCNALGFYKYRMDCDTPNSNTRAVRVVVIPGNNELKIITVMWVDEK